MLINRKHDECVPDRVRAAPEPVEPVRLARPREDALGEVRRVEDEAGDVREEGRDEGFCDVKSGERSSKTGECEN